MASNKSSSNNKIMVPQARAAMDKFKMEAANEVGVDLKKGYNGSMTTREAGSIGGQMVKKMIQSYEQRRVTHRVLFSAVLEQRERQVASPSVPV